MVNEQGYKRDKQILEDWRKDLPKGEYINRLYDLYKDYGKIKETRTTGHKVRIELWK